MKVNVSCWLQNPVHRWDAAACGHCSDGLETSQVPIPWAASSPRRLRLTPGSVNRVSSRMSHFPKGPPMIVECTPQLPQNGSPSCPKSVCRMFRSLAGMHPINWLLERYSTLRLARSPNSAGISPVSWLLSSHSRTLRKWLPQLKCYRKLGRHPHGLPVGPDATRGTIAGGGQPVEYIQLTCLVTERFASLSVPGTQRKVIVVYVVMHQEISGRCVIMPGHKIVTPGTEPHFSVSGDARMPNANIGRILILPIQTRYEFGYRAARSVVVFEIVPVRQPVFTAQSCSALAVVVAVFVKLDVYDMEVLERRFRLPGRGGGNAIVQAQFIQVIVRHVPQSFGYAPGQLVALEGQPSQVGQVAQLRRY